MTRTSTLVLSAYFLFYLHAQSGVQINLHAWKVVRHERNLSTPGNHWKYITQWAGKICWTTCFHPHSPNIRLISWQWLFESNLRSFGYFKCLAALCLPLDPSCKGNSLIRDNNMARYDTANRFFSIQINIHQYLIVTYQWLIKAYKIKPIFNWLWPISIMFSNHLQISFAYI